MDFFSSMRVSASGLEAQMQRMNTVSSNIANTETPEYRRKDPVFQAVTDRESFGEILQNELDQGVEGVLVTEIREDTRPLRPVYKPDHPKADANGIVWMPNVNPVEETANMINAQRSYEANVTALNAAKAMANKALEVGR